MLPTLEQTQAELNLPAESAEVEQLDAIYALTRARIRHTIAAEASQVLTTEAADEAIEDILAEQLEYQAEALDIPLENIDEEVDDIIDGLTTAQTFGQAFVGLLGAQYDSYEEGFNDIAQTTGHDLETLYDYAHDRDTPSEQEAMAIASCFDCCHEDPSMVQHLVAMASGDEMPEQSADYAYQQHQLQAQFSALETQRAELERSKNTERRLKQVELMADDLFKNNYITADQRRRIMPQGLEADDRADFSAFFSHTATRLGTTPEQYLDNIEFTLNFLRDGGVQNFAMLTDFSAYTDETETPDAQAQANLIEYRKRRSYG